MRFNTTAGRQFTRVMVMKNPPILIVGAGPTGLVLALWLTKAGAPVRIIDKTDGPGTTSRALVLHARNLEFYRQLGIDQKALELGLEVKALNLWRCGKAIGRLPFGDLGAALGPYPFALILPQDVHEQMLVAELQSLGIEVERGTELINFTFAGEGVSVEIQKKNAERETGQYAYLAGCDGAHSTVREKLRIGFSGGTYDDTFYVADIAGHGPVLNGEINLALDDADFLAIIPLKDAASVRLIGAVRQTTAGQTLRWEDVSQRVIQDLNITVEKVNWLSTYRVHHRVAAHFQQQGVFLLGDAAHIHSPVGGQGMNTGIGDAINLAWKLAAVVRGRSPATLLETYEPERIAFARRLVATTDRVFAFISARGPIATQIRLHLVPRLMPFLFRFAAVRRRLFRTISQIWIKYPQSPLSHGPSGTTPGGGRLPWVRFKDSTGSMADNFSSLASLDWQVHCYGTAPSALQSVCAARELPCHLFPWDPPMAAAGLRRNTAYLVRPDGHVAIVDPAGDGRRIFAHLDRWVRAPAVPRR